MFLQDTRIIQRHGAHQVHAQRFEVMFRDGSTVQLHPVSTTAPEMFLRATQLEGMRWLVFDVRRLVHTLDDDLRRLDQRDHPGAVFYSLRGTYPDAASFLAAAGDNAVARWWPSSEAPALSPTLAMA